MRQRFADFRRYERSFPIALKRRVRTDNRLGVIVEQGSFQELLLRGGSFAQMAAKQGIRPH